MIIIKIAIISPYYPPADGGIANFVKEYSEELISIGHEVIIYSREGQGVQIINEDKNTFVSKVTKELNKFNPDIIHSHSSWYALSPAISYKKYNKNVRIFFTFHTAISKINVFKKRAFTKMLNQCNHVTFVSKALELEMSNNFDITADKKVIFGGAKYICPSEEEINDFIKKFNLKKGDFHISYIGPFEWPLKVEGIKQLIRGFQEVSKLHKQTKLLIIGDGSLRPELEALIEELNLSDNIILTGHIKNVFVPLQISSIYAHISHQEGLPLSLLEAMSSGCPVVASKTGGIPEAIVDGDNGILVGKESSEISIAINKLIENESLRESMGCRNKEIINYKFNWKRSAINFLNLYGGTQ